MKPVKKTKPKAPPLIPQEGGTPKYETGKPQVSGAAKRAQLEKYVKDGLKRAFPET